MPPAAGTGGAPVKTPLWAEHRRRKVFPSLLSSPATFFLFRISCQVRLLQSEKSKLSKEGAPHPSRPFLGSGSPHHPSPQSLRSEAVSAPHPTVSAPHPTVPCSQGAPSLRRLWMGGRQRRRQPCEHSFASPCAARARWAQGQGSSVPAWPSSGCSGLRVLQHELLPASGSAVNSLSPASPPRREGQEDPSQPPGASVFPSPSLLAPGLPDARRGLTAEGEGGAASARPPHHPRGRAPPALHPRPPPAPTNRRPQAHSLTFLPGPQAHTLH